MAESIRAVDRTQLESLMVHLMRCPEVFLPVKTRLQVEDFNQAEHVFQLLWAIMTTFHDQYGEMITCSMLHTEIEANTRATPEFFPIELKESIHLFVDKAFAHPETELLQGYAFSIFESFLIGRRLLNKGRQFAERGDTQEFFDFLNEGAQKEYDKIAITRSPVVEPFAEASGDWLGSTPRLPTGLLFLDVMLGGGVRPREVYGFIAPSGGGKTTFSNQIAIAHAMNGNHVAVFTYEERVTNEYLAPVIACAAQISRKRIEQVKNPDEFTPAERERYFTAKKNIGNFLHFVDMSGATSKAGSGGIDELDATLTDFANRGVVIQAAIVDWFWPMMKRHQANKVVPRGVKPQEDRTEGQNLMDQFKQIAGARNCWIWVNHQLAPANSSKKKEAGWEDAAEFKSFAWFVNGCFALNKLDKEQIGTLSYSKARGTKGSTQAVRLDGDVATFKPLDSSFVKDERTGEYVKQGQENSVPSDYGEEQGGVSNTLNADMSGKDAAL